MYFLTVQCQHCANPECVKVCPTGASHIAADGTVQIDKEKCIGCQFCAMSCPYGVRYLNEEQRVVEKCTLCEQRIAQGELPACVAQCGGRARFFGDLDEGLASFEGPGVVDITEGDPSYEKMTLPAGRLATPSSPSTMPMFITCRMSATTPASCTSCAIAPGTERSSSWNSSGLYSFTTLIAWSSGAFRRPGQFLAIGENARKAQLPALVASVALLALSGIAVFFHLEHWERIFNGFGNPTSGITQELIVIVAFAAIAIVYFAMLRRAKTEGTVPKWCAVLAIVISVMLATRVRPLLYDGRPPRVELPA